MEGNPLAKFLPQETKVSDARDLIDRANAQFSCIDILNKEFGYDIPYGGSGSTKLHCLWGWEHKDGGIEKCMRYYWESDQAFCFRDHGVIDVVSIRASESGISKVKTAKKLLQDAGLLKAGPWRERIEKHKSSLGEPSQTFMDMRLAEQMFNTALQSVDGYGTLQFKPEIVQTKNSIIEQLDPSWDMEQLIEWLEQSKTIMKETVLVCQRKT